MSGDPDEPFGARRRALRQHPFLRFVILVQRILAAILTAVGQVLEMLRRQLINSDFHVKLLNDISAAVAIRRRRV